MVHEFNIRGTEIVRSVPRTMTVAVGEIPMVGREMCCWLDMFQFRQSHSCCATPRRPSSGSGNGLHRGKVTCTEIYLIRRKRGSSRRTVDQQTNFGLTIVTSIWSRGFSQGHGSGPDSVTGSTTLIYHIFPSSYLALSVACQLGAESRLDQQDKHVM